jgi:hypothetical protein
MLAFYVPLLGIRAMTKIAEIATTPENHLIEALKKVDQFGDIAPPQVNDPMTTVLRQNAILGNLIRWDDDRGRFVLTGTGRSRITARTRASGTVVRFRPRETAAPDARTPVRSKT